MGVRVPPGVPLTGSIHQSSNLTGHTNISLAFHSRWEWNNIIMNLLKLARALHNKSHLCQKYDRKYDWRASPSFKKINAFILRQALCSSSFELPMDSVLVNGSGLQPSQIIKYYVNLGFISYIINNDTVMIDWS